MAEAKTGQTILMIEDDPSIRKMAKIRLEREGYRVIAAPDGLEGLRLAKSERPHLILLHIMMPRMDGREVLRRLKEDQETQPIPVILLTVIGAQDEMYAPIGPGAEDRLLKPYRPQELLKRVQVALSKR